MKVRYEETFPLDLIADNEEFQARLDYDEKELGILLQDASKIPNVWKN